MNERHVRTATHIGGVAITDLAKARNPYLLAEVSGNLQHPRRIATLP